jgi:hypothetical protein
LSGSSPLSCLAWEALPVAYATPSIALGIMWPHKPHHYVKVGIPSGDIYMHFLVQIIIIINNKNKKIRKINKLKRVKILKASSRKQWRANNTGSRNFNVETSVVILSYIYKEE